MWAIVTLRMPATDALVVIQYVQDTQIAHAPIMPVLAGADHALITNHARVHAARAVHPHHVMAHQLAVEDAQTYVGVDATL